MKNNLFSPNDECPGYDTKQSDGKVSVMQEFWGMSLLSFPLWPEVVTSDRALFMC